MGGNPYYLARLSPGVLSVGGRFAGNPIDQGSGTDIIVNGTRGGSSEVTLDGAPNMAERNSVFTPPQDLVQEFKIHTATFDAALGHAAGAVSNLNMKSGTNTLPGSGYGFDSRIRAVPWFTNRFIHDPRTGPITEEKKSRALEGWLHQRWGATRTGPVIIPKLAEGRNKTFWSFGCGFCPETKGRRSPANSAMALRYRGARPSSPYSANLSRLLGRGDSHHRPPTSEPALLSPQAGEKPGIKLERLDGSDFDLRCFGMGRIDPIVPLAGNDRRWDAENRRTGSSKPLHPDLLGEAAILSPLSRQAVKLLDGEHETLWNRNLENHEADRQSGPMDPNLEYS